MFNYNDFSLPSDFLMEKYNEEYLKSLSPPSSIISRIIDNINLLMENIDHLRKWTKSKDEVSNKIKSSQSILNILYPRQNRKNNVEDKNYFSLLYILTSTLNDLLKVTFDEKRKFYKLNFNKIIFNLSFVLNETICPLKDKNIKIFTHM